MALCSLAIAFSVIGGALVARRLVWARRFACGGGPYAMAACGPGFGGPFGGFGRGGFGRRGPGGSFWLRALFHRLDTTPGQEREIRSAIEELRRTAREAKSDAFSAREGVAKAIAGEVFDGSALDEAGVKVDAAGARMKEALRAALERIHGVLDAKQRERLADILAKGPRGLRDELRGGWGGPYRGASL